MSDSFKVFVSVDYLRPHSFPGIKQDMQPLAGQSKSLDSAKRKAEKSLKDARVTGQNTRTQILNLTTGEVYCLIGGTWVLDR